jgi:hypothetical protein
MLHKFPCRYDKCSQPIATPGLTGGHMLRKHRRNPGRIDYSPPDLPRYNSRWRILCTPEDMRYKHRYKFDFDLAFQTPSYGVASTADPNRLKRRSLPLFCRDRPLQMFQSLGPPAAITFDMGSIDPPAARIPRRASSKSFRFMCASENGSGGYFGGYAAGGLRLRRYVTICQRS